MKAYYCSNHNRLLSPFHFVTPLLLACFATVLTFAPISTAARDQLPIDGTVSGSGSVPIVPYALFSFGAFSKASDLPPLRPPNPVVTRTTQIRGAEGTGSCGGGYGLGVGLVDLDHRFGLVPPLTTMAASFGARRTHPIYGQNYLEHRRCSSWKASSTG